MEPGENMEQDGFEVKVEEEDGMGANVDEQEAEVLKEGEEANELEKSSLGDGEKCEGGESGGSVQTRETNEECFIQSERKPQVLADVLDAVKQGCHDRHESIRLLSSSRIASAMGGSRRSSRVEYGRDSESLPAVEFTMNVTDIEASTGEVKEHETLVPGNEENGRGKVAELSRREQIEKMTRKRTVAKDKHYRVAMDFILKKTQTETPRAIKIQLLEEAYPIVLKTVQYYVSQLGEKNPVSIQAIDHLRKLAEKLGRKSEY
eukprot:Nk52_evm21s246 gene=Nk52_evmTU21s246